MFVKTLLGAAFVAFAFADSIPTCGGGQKCSEDSPCCSQYGQCGVGAYCLGGCDPLNSFSLNSCMPNPVCKSINSQFGSKYKGVVSKNVYLGDASKADWVAEGEPAYTSNEMLLTMAPQTVGTLVASTGYVWYGKITAVMRTSRGAGVVSAFILLSDVKDEIDYEFVGVELETAQTNFYYQGMPDYTHSANISLSDTYANYHTYTIDWQPESITWSVDGQVGRTLKRSDTWNKTASRYDFPQTPSRVQLSLWPGGADTNAAGTVQWAGGPIDWQSQLMQPQGYYFAAFKSVQIECYDPPSGARHNGTKSYVIDAYSGDNSSYIITNENTVLKSFLGSGLKPDDGAPTASGSAAPSATVQTIPGLSGAGAGADGLRGSGSSGSSGSASGSGSGGDTGSGGFSQGSSTTTKGSAGRLSISTSAVGVFVALFSILLL